MICLFVKIKRHLSFGALRQAFSSILEQVSDHRENSKVEYSIHNVLMSAFAMMYFQDSSLLEFQKKMETGCRQNNLRTLFKVDSIPKDNQMRNVLDEVDTKEIEPIFDEYFYRLQRGKYLELYRFMDNSYLVSMDGSGYFGSDKICCPGCLRKEDKKGNVSYSHQIMQAVLMHPDMKQIIPLTPEEIRNTDGDKKQDCEISAGKRLITKIRKAHPKLKMIIVADSLHSKQPFIEHAKAKGMSYILAAKEGDHKLLMEWVNEQRLLKEVSRIEVKDHKGRTHVYEWINKVLLNGNKETVWVNYFEYWIMDGGRVAYHNSWVTDMEIHEDNVEKLVKGGRCRWKIENEAFNVLKNHGYHIDHNFGHGNKHLSMNFFLLNLLAFFFHQIFELSDVLYRQCREKFGSKRNLWEHLRV
ncbi:MAG: transposase family protein, partial [Nitrospirae bacterium]|nr:transposase family protein [Nitrospirota bacterium]